MKNVTAILIVFVVFACEPEPNIEKDFELDNSVKTLLTPPSWDETIATKNRLTNNKDSQYGDLFHQYMQLTTHNDNPEYSWQAIDRWISSELNNMVGKTDIISEKKR